MGTDGWRSGTSPSSGSRDLQQSHNHPDTQKQPCVGGVGTPSRSTPLPSVGTTGTQGSPPPDSQGAQHPWERIPRLHPLHRAEQGGRRRGCWRQALPHGPLLRAREWKQIAKQQEKKKKNQPPRLLVHPLVGADRLLSYSYEPAWEEEREHLYLFH